MDDAGNNEAGMLDTLPHPCAFKMMDVTSFPACSASMSVAMGFEPSFQAALQLYKWAPGACSRNAKPAFET
jgi:hypothetical protein